MTDEEYSYLNFELPKQINTGANVFSFSVATGTLGFLLASAHQGVISGVGGFFAGFSLSFVPLTVAILVEAFRGGEPRGKGDSPVDEFVKTDLSDSQRGDWYRKALLYLAKRPAFEATEVDAITGGMPLTGEIKFARARDIPNPDVRARWEDEIEKAMTGILGKSLPQKPHWSSLRSLRPMLSKSSVMCPLCGGHLNVEAYPESAESEVDRLSRDKGETR